MAITMSSSVSLCLSRPAKIGIGCYLKSQSAMMSPMRPELRVPFRGVPRVSPNSRPASLTVYATDHRADFPSDTPQPQRIPSVRPKKRQPEGASLHTPKPKPEFKFKMPTPMDIAHYVAIIGYAAFAVAMLVSPLRTADFLVVGANEVLTSPAGIFLSRCCGGFCLAVVGIAMGLKGLPSSYRHTKYALIGMVGMGASTLAVAGSALVQGVTTATGGFAAVGVSAYSLALYGWLLFHHLGTK